jgi:myxalamid-type polyketide synthase MxaE and MxaD
MGIDSLMAIELQNRLEVAFDCSLGSTLVFSYPTIEDLASHLAEDVLPLEFSSEKDLVSEEAKEVSLGETLSDKLDQLSEDDLVKLLAKELVTIEKNKKSEE